MTVCNEYRLEVMGGSDGSRYLERSNSMGYLNLLKDCYHLHEISTGSTQLTEPTSGLEDKSRLRKI